MDIAKQIRTTLEEGKGKNAIHYQGVWYSWDELNKFAHSLNALLNTLGTNENHAIGFVARNQVAHAATLAALVGHNRPVTMLYAFQSAQGLANNIAELNLKVLVASREDWNTQTLNAAHANGTIAICIDSPLTLTVISPEQASKVQAAYRQLPEPGIEILSSGTTGTPKRIFHPTPILFRTLISAGQAEYDGEAPPDIVCWPFSGIGGVCQIIRPLALGLRAILLERFSVASVVNAIQEHQPQVFAATPTMLRMIYDAQVPPEQLRSLKMVYGGSGPLDLALMDQFETKYNIPIIWAMGATEFCGTIISWTPDLKQQFHTQKRGSSGKPLPGVSIRIVDPDSHAVLPANQVGCMDVKVDILGNDWVLTTDLAKIDEDGFVYLVGRNDGAIIRGGFKVLPESINECLRSHPSVEEAAVLGVNDSRLGQVPVAIVQLHEHCNNTQNIDLNSYLRERLAPTQIPVAFHTIQAMPYTASLKINLASLRELYESGQLPVLSA